MTDERWLPIPNWEGHYEASDHGRVKSVERVIVRIDGREQPLHEKILKPQTDTQGRLYVGLHIGSKRVHIRISTLVLVTFVGPRPAGMEACHEDDDRTNNHLTNLRWDTRPANIADRYRNGRDGQAKRIATFARKRSEMV